MRSLDGLKVMPMISGVQIFTNSEISDLVSKFCES